MAYTSEMGQHLFFCVWLAHVGCGEKNTVVQVLLQHTLPSPLEMHSIVGLLEHVGGFDFKF